MAQSCCLPFTLVLLLATLLSWTVDVNASRVLEEADAPTSSPTPDLSKPSIPGLPKLDFSAYTKPGFPHMSMSGMPPLPSFSNHDFTNLPKPQMPQFAQNMPDMSSMPTMPDMSSLPTMPKFDMSKMPSFDMSKMPSLDMSKLPSLSNPSTSP